MEILDASPTELGGFKEIILMVNGPKAYGRLKYESGTHRVQRVPDTEAQGRVHTSAATVAVLPEVEEVEVKVDPKDVRMDVFCSTGAGGQSVNTTYSAVRLTHIPTRDRGAVPGRAVPVEKSHQSHEGALGEDQGKSRFGKERTRGEGPQEPSGKRGPKRKNPDLQFSAEPRDRPSHRIDAPPTRPCVAGGYGHHPRRAWPWTNRNGCFSKTHDPKIGGFFPMTPNETHEVWTPLRVLQWAVPYLKEKGCGVPAPRCGMSFGESPSMRSLEGLSSI
jgi:hypothetical protein